MEQVLQSVKPTEAYFWTTHNGAELDLFFLHRGRRYGIEVKFNEAPILTRSMQIALEDLGLEHLWVIYPGQERYPIDKRITTWPLQDMPSFRLLN